MRKRERARERGRERGGGGATKRAQTLVSANSRRKERLELADALTPTSTVQINCEVPYSLMFRWLVISTTDRLYGRSFGRLVA